MTIRHAAINADDIDATLAFYDAVFGWKFAAWGPGFYRMETGNRAPEVVVAMQQRRDLISGHRTVGFECTVAVDDLAAVTSAALAHGGTVLTEPAAIPGVGELVWLEDPSGNVVGAMRYEPSKS